MALRAGELIHVYYEVIYHLRFGSYGDVYSAETYSGRAIALNAERQDSRQKMLRWEDKVYEKLHSSSRQAIGVPKVTTMC